jgi:hypothetical protein
MNRTPVVAQLGVVCLCLVLAAACAAEEDIAATPTATTPEATPTSPQTASPGPGDTPITRGTTDISSGGEWVESLANTAVRRVLWEDGTTYEGSISDQVSRTAGTPDAGHGHRVVPRWLGDARCQVTIFMRVVDRSTEPPTVTDLLGEFYYDEEKDEFTAANGRARFALTGINPCTSAQPEPDYCPLDKEVRA